MLFEGTPPSSLAVIVFLLVAAAVMIGLRQRENEGDQHN